MADDDDPKAGELVTANYGWTKPTVGASDDQWGGYLNADLDGIDSVVHGIDTRPAYVLPVASTTVLGGAKVDGTTIHAAPDGTLSGTPSSGPPVTISATAPASPQVGALWWDSVGGQLYTFYNDGNSSQWVIAVNAGASLQPASTTVLGGVKVDGTTIKAAVDGTISAPIFMGDNRIINGDMRIDQRNNGASGTAAGYTVDRWAYYGTQASKLTWQRQSVGPAGFPYCLSASSSSAYTAAAADQFIFYQSIEADMASDFAWGTASAQPVTLSFWVQSSKTGAWSGGIGNFAGTRSYPFSFSPATTGWSFVTVTIPGDTAGAWVMSGNAGGVTVYFDLGSGANARGAVGSWRAGTITGITGTNSVVATNGATFYVTGVKLEIGSVATPYNRQSLAKSMADCQRYYQTTQWAVAGYGLAGTPLGAIAYLGTTMRAAPTVVVGSTIGADANVSSIGPADTILPNSFRLLAYATATASTGAIRNVSASAEL